LLEDGVVEPIESEPQQTARATILPEGTAEERYKYAFDLLRKAQYDEAANVLSAFIEVHRDHPLAENASYWRGETFYARKMFGDAARIYATNLQLYPEGAKAPDNMVKLGMALANLERAKEACQAFAELERKYPEMPANVRQAADRGRNTAGCP
ncbi:MAG TPA: tol-pal system protein YbgF, partial [Alphaproteobacteria bacterium]|nr:tol-pal system protein YbgF [Alphaproteobacteria bacterium]